MMSNVQLWIISWGELLDGILGIVSFGILRPAMAYKLSCFFAIRNGRKKWGKD